jgi:EF hand
MWRYLAGGGALLSAVAAGFFVIGVHGKADPILPAQPQQAVATADTPASDSAVPEASPATREQKRFDRYDKDRDARITREEYLAARRKAFAKLDANGDGRLDFDEWAIKATTKFAAADRDKSGAMDAAEFATTAVKRKAPSRTKCPPPSAAPADDS